MSTRGRCTLVMVCYDYAFIVFADLILDGPADTLESDSKLDQVDNPGLAKDSPANK